MKDEITPRSCRRRHALLWIIAGLALTAGTFYLALDMLDETRAYLENERTPILLPGGGAKF